MRPFFHFPVMARIQLMNRHVTNVANGGPAGETSATKHYPNIDKLEHLDN